MWSLSRPETKPSGVFGKIPDRDQDHWVWSGPDWVPISLGPNFPNTSLSTLLKTSVIKNLARRSSLPTIRRPRSLLPLPPQAHFITHNSLPTNLVSTKQLKDGRKQEESILSYERIGMAELAAMSLKVSICCQCLPAVTG